MSALGTWPVNPFVFISAENVDGVDNAIIQHGADVVSWANEGSMGIDFTPTGLLANTATPLMKKSALDKAVSFDGVSDVMTALGSAAAVGTMIASPFDLVLFIRRKGGSMGASRILLGTKNRGFSLWLTNYVAGVSVEGGLQFKINNGSTNVIDITTQFTTPLGEVSAIFIRFTGTKIRITRDFYHWEEQDVVGSLLTGAAGNDLCVGSYTPAPPSHLECTDADYKRFGLWPRNLNPAELTVVRWLFTSLVGNGDRRPMVAALGDSLTLGNTADERHPITARLDAHPSLYPQIGVANFGVGGDIVSGFQTRYTQQIKNNGYVALRIPVPVNDIIALSSAAATWALLEALINEAIADGLKVFLGNGTPFGGYSGWTAPMQVQWDAIRALATAKGGVTLIDNYAPMGAPGNPVALDPRKANADQLHYNYPNGSGVTSGVEEMVIVEAPIFALAYPVPVPIVPPVSTVVDFTWADVVGGVPNGIAAELAGLPLLSQTEVLEQVAEEVNVSRWGSLAKANTAGIWLARHLGSLRKGGTGTITGVTVGQVSKQFASPMSQDALQSTRYGAEYLRLVKLRMPRFALT